MENSRTHITLAGGGFTNLYTAASLAVGTKLGLQNLSSDPIVVSIGASGNLSKGYVINSMEFFVVPAGVPGCFVQTVTGESGVVMLDVGGYSIPNAPLDERLYTGYKALVVQSFTESNSKNGTQHSLSTRNIAVAAGGTLDVTLTTGALPVIIKGLAIQYTGSQIETTLYKGTVATGGATLSQYNMNTQAGLSPLSIAKTSSGSPFTITNQGVQASPTEFFYGIADQGNRSTPSFITAGIERILAPNIVYMRRIYNRGTGPCIIDFTTTYYEGEISSSNG